MISAEKQPAPGYKQTELGAIPVEWKSEKLGNLVEICSGESPSKFNFRPEGTPYFKVEQLNNHSVYAEFTPYFIENAKIIPSGSVIFPKRGASILSNKIRILKHDSFMDTNLMTLTCAASLDGKYLYNQLNYRGLDSVADTTSIPQINNKHIIPFCIPLPVLEEQTAIANALSDVDSLINELEGLIEKKQAIKTATMQQLLTGKTRLPQFARYTEGDKQGQLKEMKDSELGEIPEDWDIYAIGALFSITAGGDLRKTQFSPIKTDKHSYPIYSNAITNKGLYGYCSTFDYDGEYLTITARGGIGHAIERNESFCAIGRLLVLSTKQNTNCKYVAEFTNQYIEFANESTGVPQLTAPQVAKYNIALPEFEEQTAIADILSDIDEEIQGLEQRLSKTRQIKQGMMQELLTGRTRLPFNKDS